MSAKEFAHVRAARKQIDETDPHAETFSSTGQQLCTIDQRVESWPNSISFLTSNVLFWWPFCAKLRWRHHHRLII